MDPTTAVPPAAAPVDPTVVDAAPATGASSKTKGPRKRTSIRSLRVAIADQEQLNASYRESIDRIARRLGERTDERYRLEEQVTETNTTNEQQARRIVNLETALEFVLSIVVMDKSPNDAMKLLTDKANEFSVDFRNINGELLDALGKAYAKAPTRAADAANIKALTAFTEKLGSLTKGAGRPSPDMRAVSGSGIDSLMALLGMGGDEGPDCRDPECRFHERSRGRG